jgi:uncharacterized membrane protein
MVLNLLIVATFAVDLWLRDRSGSGAGLPVALSAFAVVMLLASGWLGGEMVYVHGAGVEPPEQRRETQIRTEMRRQAKGA